MIEISRESFIVMGYAATMVVFAVGMITAAAERATIATQQGYPTTVELSEIMLYILLSLIWPVLVVGGMLYVLRILK